MSIVIQKIRQLRMQKTAISFARRSAVLSRASSALQPDFRILWNTSIFHHRAYQRSLSTAARFAVTGRSVTSLQSIRGRSAGSSDSRACRNVRVRAG